MHGRKRKAVVASVAAVAVVGGGAAAVAATRGTTPAEESNAVVEDAAKQLGVAPDKLRAALKEALGNRIDAAVAAGRLTEEQGARAKERLRSDGFPLFGRGFGPGRGLGPGFGHRFGQEGFGHRRFGHGAKLEAAATYLGLSQEALREKLRGGATLADVAKERGKPVDGLVAALVAQTRQRLEQAVKDGRLTEARKQELLQGVEERVRALVNGERPQRPFGRRGPWS
jgi:hypothetical protein